MNTSIALQDSRDTVAITLTDRLELTPVQAFNKTANVDLKLDEVIGVELDVIGIYSDTVAVRSIETEELEDMERVVLFLKENKTVQSVSRTFIHALKSVIGFIGMDSFKVSGVKIIPKRINSRGRNIYTVEVVE
jgi:hypothetical protein